MQYKINFLHISDFLLDSVFYYKDNKDKDNNVNLKVYNIENSIST